MIPIIVLTNGRRACLERTMPAARHHLHGAGPVTIVDDSGDPAYRAWLADSFTADVVPVDDRPAGYWRAMRTVWDLARPHPHTFLLEDDFVLQADIDLAELAAVLDTRPYLAQIALLRQPWFHNEHAAGGLIGALEQHGHAFTETTDGTRWWIEHRACFTGNPTLLPARTTAREWPAGDWSESRFGQALFTDPAARCAYWGRRADPPRVEHIGHTRAGHSY